MTQRSVPATLFRGGTSKGVYFEREVLPDDGQGWDDLLLRLFGSPDPMQLDGIGGSHSTTSKTMIVSANDDPDRDVEYAFGQVGVEKPVVDWGGNCGNLTFAIGSFALEREIVTVETADIDSGCDGDRRVELALENTNTGTVVEQSIPVDSSGKPRYAGDFHVAGVPRPGARIRSRFLAPGGSMTSGTFPTGNRVDVLDVPSVGELEASLVDISNPCVFVRARDIGLTGSERPEEIDDDPAVLERLETIRSAACARLGFVDDPDRATAESPGVPKMAVVGGRQRYETVAGETVSADDYDLLARIMSMQKAHHAYAVTGAMCTAAAAFLPGTIPNEFLADDAADAVRLGHPKGTMRVGVDVNGDQVSCAIVDRTARRIMDGRLFDPKPY